MYVDMCSECIVNDLKILKRNILDKTKFLHAILFYITKIAEHLNTMH